MSMTNHEEFAARLSRIRAGGDNTNATIFVGNDARHQLERRQPKQKVTKQREIAGNALYPLSLVAALLLGMVAVMISRYAVFHLAAGVTQQPGSPTELLLSAGVGLAVSFVLSQAFKLRSKQHASIQGIGVLIMVCSFHNLVHWMPDLAAKAFSPRYVADLIHNTPPNSIRLMNSYYMIREGESSLEAALTGLSANVFGSAVEVPAMTCAPAAETAVVAAPEVTILQTQNAKKSKNGGKPAHKTLAAPVAAEATAAPCPTE